MNTDGVMMPMVETNLETVRNPTNLFVGGCQVIRKHMREMPEQELVNVAHPESENGKRDLMRNNGVHIKKLNWSYAALMSAIVKFESDFARNAFDQNRMLLR